jgi:hypothetical protein
VVHKYSKVKTDKNKMIFDWKLFSFVNLDWTWVQRELLIIPVLVLVLWFFWMRSVREAIVDEQTQVGTFHSK